MIIKKDKKTITHIQMDLTTGYLLAYYTSIWIYVFIIM